MAESFEIRAGNLVIGVSNLEEGDPPMGVASGALHSTDAYAAVRAVFLLFRQAMDTKPEDEVRLREYYAKRDSLGLSVWSSSGDEVGTQWVHIEDYLDDLGEIWCTLVVDRHETYERFFPEHRRRYDEQW